MTTMIVCTRIWLMWVCTLWVGIKPTHSSFLPTMLYTSREGKPTKSSNNFFRQSVVRNTNDDDDRIPMRNFSNKELPSNINVLSSKEGLRRIFLFYHLYSIILLHNEVPSLHYPTFWLPMQSIFREDLTCGR